MNYRRDIDGLRAVAVLPVVIYHIAQSYMPGGFVGVDIFFVISGYLIGNNILRMVEQGNFSILGFYERRLRRIAPAYLVVLVFCTIVSSLYRYPNDLISYVESLFSSIFSVSNIYFYLTTGYFTMQAGEIPLLHTWSLSVEEQFYLIFPLIAFLPMRIFMSFRASFLCLLLGLSFVCSVVMTRVDPAFAFYMLPARAWELLMGSVLALKVVPLAGGQIMRNVLAIAGAGMIVYAMAFFSHDTPFPGFAAMLPCLGAALLLHAGESGDNHVSRLLSWKVPVFFGVISYSLYLWHWPIFVFQKTNSLFVVTDSKMVERGVVLALSILFATLSLYFVERLTRDRSIMHTKALVAGVVAVLIPLAGTGALAFLTNGLPARFSPEAVQIASYRAYGELPTFRSGACFLNDRQAFGDFDRTLCMPSEHKEAIVLLGDSHAAALYPGLVAAFPDKDILQITGVRCPPLVVPQPSPGAACAEMIDFAIYQLPRMRTISAYVLASRWNVGTIAPTTGFNPNWMDDIAETVEAIRKAGAKVVVVGPMPEYRWALPKLLADAAQFGDRLLAQRNMSGDSLLLDEMMAKYMDGHAIPYASFKSYICPDGSCREYAQSGIPLLFDETHLTTQGSIDVVTGAIAGKLR